MFRPTRARAGMRLLRFGAAVALFAGASVHAQRVPQTKNEVARPGGTLPGSPKVAFVKVAEGFNDPTNVASPNDGTGRIFVVERVGRVKIVTKDGKLLPEPFLGLTKINPPQRRPHRRGRRACALRSMVLVVSLG